MTISILMFCSQFRPMLGGAERQAEKLSYALLRKGCHVEVLTPRLVPTSPLLEDADGLVIHRFPLVDIKRCFNFRGLRLPFLILQAWQTRRAVDHDIGRFDIIHTHIASLATALAAQSARAATKPVICKVGMAGERNDINEVSRTAFGFGGRQIARSLIDSIDYWVATTESVKDSINKEGVPEERIRSIPNGVDITELGNSRGYPLYAKKFLYLGRLSTNIDRDVPTLIQAFNRIADHVPDAELAIVGDGDLHEQMMMLAQATAHADRIQMPGRQDPSRWLEWADCFVLPSRREGLSNALLEAMAAGLPCIANDIPPNREVLENGEVGPLVPVGDVEALSATLKQFAMEPGLSESYGKRAFARARERYAIDIVAGEYMKLYDHLIQLASDRAGR